MSDISAKITSIEPARAAEGSAKKPIALSPIEMPLTPQPLQSAPKLTARPIWGICALVSLLWAALIGGIFYIEFLADRPEAVVTLWQLATFTLLALMPIAMIWLLGLASARLFRASAQASALVAAVDQLSRPDETAKTRAVTLAGAVRSQIISVDTELQTALDRLAEMENTIAGHTQALNSSHIAATRQTGEIASRLTEERDGLKSISTMFDERMAALSRMLSEHSERLATATHIAEQKIQEARVSVEGAAAKINASSEIVRENALKATEVLGASHNQITDLGDNIRGQSLELDAMNSRHAEEMRALLDQLSAEQEQMERSIEARLAQMRDLSLSAKVSAEKLAEASAAGRQTVEALAASANLTEDAVRQRFREMEDMVRFSDESASTLSERASQRVRDSLALTRLEIGRIEDDMRALEQRLASGAAFERAELRNTASLGAEAKPSWRKSLLRFRPVLDFTMEPSDDGGAAALGPLNAPKPEVTEALPPKSPAGAEEQTRDTQLLPLTLEADVSSAPAPIPQDNADPESFAIPRLGDEPNARPRPRDVEQASAEPEALSPTLELDEEAGSPELLTLPLRNADLLAPVALSRPAATAGKLRRKKPEKSGWSWRGFLGGIDKDMAKEIAKDEANAPLLVPAPEASNAPSLEEQTAHILTRLKAIDLAPNAIVDEGCIIESVNIRKFKGPSAMRDVVRLRLPGPISHLEAEMEMDPGFRNEAERFAVAFYQALGDDTKDREALRLDLEKEAGRAFILCDTALG